MTRGEIEKKAKDLGILDIRFGQNNCTLEDYEIAIKSAEMLDERFTDQLFEKADRAGASGISI